MKACCEIPISSPSADHATFTVAVAGNPNSGKTTIFNALTGLRQKVANYPGVTVEKKTGHCKLPDGTVADIVDLPGTYSLISRSPDERVAMEVLRGLRADTRPPDAVIVVVDASNLPRNLYLVSQLIELGRPMVVALNMMDIAQRRNLAISPQRLSTELGVPVIPVVGHKRQGIDELKAAIKSACVAPMPDWALPGEMREELTLVGGGLAILDSRSDSAEPRAWICPDGTPRRLERYQAIAERLLIGDTLGDLHTISESEPVASLLASAGRRLAAAGVDAMQADIEAHYHWIDAVAARALVPACQNITAPDATPQAAKSNLGILSYAPRPSLTDRVDRIIMHRVWGLLIFAAVMSLLFVAIFSLAQPIMDGIGFAIKWLGIVTTSHLGDGPLKDLINNGIFAGVGTVVVFLPQIALLFFFLAILEDSGYLARAAFLMDRLLSKVGLHGKSFIPLLSSFACAIPGIMATRTIENRKDRLATILIAPFMSCSARLPVYTLLIGACFIHYGPIAQAGVMLACYALGILAAVATALVFKRTFLKGTPSSFILELPIYKVPQASVVARHVWTNAREFLVKAGTLIFAMSVILWALAYYPRMPAEKADAVRADALPRAQWAILERSIWKHLPSLSDLTANEQQQASNIADNAVAAAQSEYSFAGRFGHAIEPAIRPLGYDWKMGIGLIAAFAARETFVSTEGVVYAAGDTDKNGTKPLADAMRADAYANGQPVWTPLVAVSLLIWFVLAMQCMSTLAIVRRETGGWTWPIFMTLYMNGLAYVICLLVYQTGRRIIG